MGTLAEIVDRHRSPDALIGLAALGITRSRFHRAWVQDNELLESDCKLLDDTPGGCPSILETSTTWSNP